MQNRQRRPETKKFEKISLISPEKLFLLNRIPVYKINSDNLDVVRIDFLFHAGVKFEPSPLIGTTVNLMLREGTRSYSSAKISGLLDYYGSFLESTIEKDVALISLYSLHKFLPNTLKILEEIIKYPTFPPNELSIHLQNRKQHYIVENEKISTQAKKKIQEVLFGEKHPYGRSPIAKDFDQVVREDLVTFHNNYYNSNNCKIILSGKIDESVLILIDNHFGVTDWTSTTPQHPPMELLPPPAKKLHVIQKEKAVQSALRMGKFVVNKTHPDHLKLQVLNTLLGGFFGSRLNKTIREEKGYTYGIGSALVSLHEACYWVIISDLNGEATKAAITDVFSEIKRLQQEKPEEKELERIKDYMRGEILRSLDGPFAIADNLRILIEFDLDFEYINRSLDEINQITAGEIQELAGKYMKEEDFYVIVAGKYD